MNEMCVIILIWLLGAILSAVLLEIHMPHRACYIYWLALWPFVSFIVVAGDLRAFFKSRFF